MATTKLFVDVDLGPMCEDIHKTHKKKGSEIDKKETQRGNLQSNPVLKEKTKAKQ